jgi:phosphoglycerol transferase MdoB-like AlkP superfamily enzyme
MSKKTNTLLFILGGTIFNVFVTIICFLLFLVVYSRFLYGRVSENVAAWLLPVFFAGAIAASFFIYRLAIKILVKKVDMEKYFDPIFVRRKKGK